MPDIIKPVGPPDDETPPPDRWLWFVGIAVVSSLAVAAVAYALRALIL